MIANMLWRYRVTEKLGAGGRIQCVAGSSHADQNWIFSG